MDPAFWDTMRWDYFRWDSYSDEWDILLGVFEGITSTDWSTLLGVFEEMGSCNVTRRVLSLGSRDATTRWRAKTFAEDTVKAILIPRSSAQLALKAGTYVRTDALLLTAVAFYEGDEVKDAFNNYWEVKAVRDISVGDNFSHRECDLVLLPLHG